MIFLLQLADFMTGFRFFDRVKNCCRFSVSGDSEALRGAIDKMLINIRVIVFNYNVTPEAYLLLLPSFFEVVNVVRVIRFLKPLDLAGRGIPNQQ